VGQLEDILTVACLMLDLYADPESYIAQQIETAERARDAETKLKWLRVDEAVRAMLSERQTHSARTATGT
jgi:hypothetical protein